MKLIIAGSTGFVGTEIIRQAVSNPAITSIMALARRVTAVPENVKPGADEAKLKSVVCEDFGNYPQTVKEQLAGADACIWYINDFLIIHLLLLPSPPPQPPWQMHQ
jgi:nucleoside-diphosphate-sugar epimerase